MIPNDIEKLVERVEALPDASARAAALELVQGVMSLHAEAIGRVLELTAQSAPGLVKTLGADETVSRVLALHGLHPDDFGTRLSHAMDKLHIWFDTRGARIELIEAAPQLVRLRFATARRGAGGPSGRPARRAVEDAIYESVPEISKLVIEGLDEVEERMAAGGREGFVPLESLVAKSA